MMRRWQPREEPGKSVPGRRAASAKVLPQGELTIKMTKRRPAGFNSAGSMLKLDARDK